MMGVDYQPAPQPPPQVDRPVVVNDVLCFVCNYRRQIGPDRLRRLLCEHFSADAVAHAESLLGQFVPEEAPSVVAAASDHHRTPDRLLDLFDRCSDAGEVPVFAASDLRALPLCLRDDDDDDDDDNDGRDEPVTHALVLREIRHLKRLILERGWPSSAAPLHHHLLQTSPPMQRSTSTALNVDTFPTPAKSDKHAALSASSPESPTPIGTAGPVRKKSEATSGVKLDAAVKRLADRQKASVSSNGGGAGDKSSPTAAAAAAAQLDDRQKDDDAAPKRSETVERRVSGEERTVEHLNNTLGLMGAAPFAGTGWANCYPPALAGQFDPAVYMGIFRQLFLQQQQQQHQQQPLLSPNGLFPIVRPPASDPSSSMDFKEELASPTQIADGSIGGSRSDSRQRKSSRDDDDDDLRMLDTEKSNSSGGDSPSPSDTSNRDEAGYSLRDVAQDAVDKPFECQHANCHKRFANKFLLKKHEFIHTGERPHQCPYCGKRFNRKDNLLRHKKTHLANALANAKHHPLAAFGSASTVDAIKLAAESSSAAAAFARSLSAADASLAGDDC